MNIEEIRRRSLEYAKGHVKTGPTWRTPKKKRKGRKPLAYAEWFALSLKDGKPHGGPPRKNWEPRQPRPDSLPSDQGHRYVPNPADALRDPNRLPWD